MQQQESLQSYQHMFTDFAMNNIQTAADPNLPAIEEKSGRRVRTQYSEFQLKELEREFNVNGAFLHQARRIDIANRLGVPEKQIKIWFQNHRMKVKKLMGILPNGNKIVKPKPPKIVKSLPVIKPLVAEIIGSPAIKPNRDFNPQVLVQVPAKANHALPRLPETVQIQQQDIQQIRWVVVDTPNFSQQPKQPPIQMPAQPQHLLSETEANCIQQGNVPASAPQQQQYLIQQGHIQQEIVQHTPVIHAEHHQPASSMFTEGQFNINEFIDSFDKFVDETKDQELNETEIAKTFNFELGDDLEIDDLLNLSRSDIMDISFLSEAEPPTPTITISYEDIMNPKMKISF